MNRTANIAHINLIAPPPSRKNAHSKAFTLAETLLTLAILGVIAAMTIPGLQKNSQQRELHAAAKKAYSSINQALERAQLEMGYPVRCFYGINGETARLNDCNDSFFSKFFKNSFNVSQYCPTNAYINGCMPNYKGVEAVYKNYNPTINDDDLNQWLSANCGGFGDSRIKSGPAFVTADGMIIFPYRWMPVIAVDVNGHKPPNKWGYDLFSFGIVKDKDSAPYFDSQGACEYPEPGGRSIKSVLGGR